MKTLVKVFLCVALGLLSFAEAQAATMKLCGQNLSYDVVPPSRNLSPELSAFSGIWVGGTYANSEYSSCDAFVVEEVGANGRVRVQQAWSDTPTAGGWSYLPKNSGTTKESWTGHIANGSLVLIATKVTYELSIDKNNPNKMVGYISVTQPVNGRYPVQLDLVQKF